jgi:uncharacterized membrane protein YdjX (TVP38/TMEM64 family)
MIRRMLPSLIVGAIVIGLAFALLHSLARHDSMAALAMARQGRPGLALLFGLLLLMRLIAIVLIPPLVAAELGAALLDTIVQRRQRADRRRRDGHERLC